MAISTSNWEWSVWVIADRRTPALLPPGNFLGPYRLHPGSQDQLVVPLHRHDLGSQHKLALVRVTTNTGHQGGCCCAAWSRLPLTPALQHQKYGRSVC